MPVPKVAPISSIAEPKGDRTEADPIFRVFGVPRAFPVLIGPEADIVTIAKANHFSTGRTPARQIGMNRGKLLCNMTALNPLEVSKIMG